MEKIISNHIPITCECARLVDKGLLRYEASASGHAERYGRGETSHTIHVWWARRPHTAMRALVFASLCKTSGPRAEYLLKEIGRFASLSGRIADQARDFLSAQYADPPKVLDMFGGGGTIAFEALNLGAEIFSIDANPLSVFIQKCNLVYSRFVEKKYVRALLEESGERVLNRLEKETDPLYPLRHSESETEKTPSVFGYLWTYSTECEACGYRYFMIKRPWLSKKQNKRIALIAKNGERRQTVSAGTVPGNHEYPSAWIGRNGITRCPKCRHTQKANIWKCADEMVAMIRPAFGGRGKTFVAATGKAVPNLDTIRKKEIDALDCLNLELPTSELPVWSGIVNPAIYGIRTHADFLNPRQRAVLVLLIQCLNDEYERLEKSESGEIAKCIISLLAGLIDQMVDWNCRLSMWIPQNEQVGRGFCGPGVSMLWDYAEIDPLSRGPGNLRAKLQRIVKGALAIGRFSNPAHIRHAHAQNLPYENDCFDAIITDPPYYDNIYYSALADFFFAWKRLLLHKIDPDLFETKSTDSERELVASAKKFGSPAKAHEIYCEQLARAIGEAERVIKPGGIFSFIYSHSSLKGWEAFVSAYRPSNFFITSVQPLCIERKQRPRAMTSNAVNTCIVFVARKSNEAKREMNLQDIVGEMESICDSDYIPNLIEWGWREQDAALAAFANGIGLLANTNAIDGVAGTNAIIAMENVITTRVNSFRLAKRRSL